MLLVVVGFLLTMVQLCGCVCIIYITRKQLLRMLHSKLSLFRRRDAQQQTSEQENARKKYSRGQLQLVKAFGAIFSVSVLTYLPVVVLVILLAPMNVLFNRHPYYMVAYVFFMSRSVLHPIVESYMTCEIRNVVSKFCVRVRRCKHLKKERDEVLARADMSTPNSRVGGGGSGGGGEEVWRKKCIDQVPTDT